MIDPCDLKPLLPNIFLVDCPTRDDRDWVYRLIGTEIVDREGGDRTGRPVCEGYSGATWPQLRSEYRMCMDERRAVHRADTAPFGMSGVVFDFERVLLPLAADGYTVDKIIGVVDYLPVGALDFRKTA
jgi:hypothetical protein